MGGSPGRRPKAVLNLFVLNPMLSIRMGWCVLRLFTDRYGDIPQSVENLMKIALIKEISSGLFVSDISQKDDLIIFTFQKEISARAIVEVMDLYRRKMMFSSGSVSYLSYKYDKDILDNIKIILQTIEKAIHEDEL